MIPRAAMVMAAGLGTRMRPLTDTRPKPLIRVAGRALVDHALDRLAAAGVARAVVNLHYLGEQIRAHLAGRSQPEIRFSGEPALLETGGGIVRALPLLGDAPFAVLNSDALWHGPNPVATLAGAWDGAAMDALLLCVPREAAHGYTRAGDFFLEGGPGPGPAPVRRRGDAASAPYVYTGAQILAPRAFEGCAPEPFSVNRVWDRLMAAGRLAAVVHPGAWADVGTPAGIATAEAMLAGAPAP